MILSLTIYGAGYVGLVSAVCFAKLGIKVLCVDVDKNKIDLLQKGICPIFEDNLPELLKEQLAIQQLQFTTNMNDAIKHSSLHMIAVGTPSLESGAADLSQVYSIVNEIMWQTTADLILIIKSTVPVGTGNDIENYIRVQQATYGKSYNLAVVSNPEFLREGSAVYDFMNADRIILGGESSILLHLKQIYQPLVQLGVPIHCMSRTSAELTKYAANAMLASRISFINQISQIASVTGANIDEVRVGIGSDQRIGPHFLQAGIGYGGSCFPKDVRALMYTASYHNVNYDFLRAIDSVNELQKKWAIEQLLIHFKGQLEGLVIGIWGLAFKPGTDDMREASSLVIMRSLLEKKVKLRVYDPVAMSVAKTYFGTDDSIVWCESADNVLRRPLDALIIATEWPEFKRFSADKLCKLLAKSPLIDGRNCFSLKEIEAVEITYYSVGRELVKN